MVFGSATTHLWVCAGAETAGEITAHVELHISVAHQQSLGISIDGDELHPSEAKFDHAVDGVDAATADSDNLYDG